MGDWSSILRCAVVVEAVGERWLCCVVVAVDGFAVVVEAIVCWRLATEGGKT